MSDFAVFIEEEDMCERFIQEVMCEGYYGYDFMDDKNPMKNVFIRWCMEQYEIKKEEEKLDKEDEKMNVNELHTKKELEQFNDNQDSMDSYYLWSDEDLKERNRILLALESPKCRDGYKDMLMLQLINLQKKYEGEHAETI